MIVLQKLILKVTSPVLVLSHWKYKCQLQDITQKRFYIQNIAMDISFQNNMLGQEQILSLIQFFNTIT